MMANLGVTPIRGGGGGGGGGGMGSKPCKQLVKDNQRQVGPRDRKGLPDIICVRTLSECDNCIQYHSTVPTLLQLAARSLCSRTDAFLQDWSHRRGFAVSNRQSPSTDSEPTGSGDTSCPSMENATMVPITSDNVSRPSTSGTADNMDDNQAGRTNAKSSTSRVAYRRQRYRDKELSEEATSLLLRSRRLN